MLEKLLPGMTAFEYAVEVYGHHATRDPNGDVVASNAVRAITARALHALCPGWHKRFSLDAVEREVLAMPPRRRAA